jgi:arsenate reductase-like glutaredoxin family protein
LRERSVDVDEVNYAKKPLDEATVQSIVKAAGGVGAVLNARHEIAKEKGWGAAPPSPAEFAKAAAKEPNLLRRPILVSGKKVLVGYDKKNQDDWAKL